MLGILESVYNLVTFGGLGQKTAGEFFSMLGSWALIMLTMKYQYNVWQAKRTQNQYYAKLARQLERVMNKTGITDVDQIMTAMECIESATVRDKHGKFKSINFSKLAQSMGEETSWHNQAIDYATKQYNTLKRGKQQKAEGAGD